MRRLVTLVLAAALSLTTAQFAEAKEAAGGPAGGYSATEIQGSFDRVQLVLKGQGQVANDLDRQIMSSVVGLGKQVGDSFSRAPLTGSITPNVGGGWDGGGPYLTFSQFEQDLVIAGWGFALGAAICAVPAVGQIACVVVGAVLTVLTVFLSHNKKCPGKAKVYLNRLGRIGSAVCVR